MDTAQITAGSIVVGVDGSRDAERALDWASDQAGLERRTLTLVHAVQPLGPGAGTFLATGIDYGGLAESLLAAGGELLSTARAHALTRHPSLEVAEVLRSADTRNELLELSERASMVVLGSRGRGPVSSLLLGSVSVSVSKHASSPVVVCRPAPGDEPRHGVVVGVDGTERSLPAVEFAFRMAAVRGERLTVLHCYWDDAALAVPHPSDPGTDPDEMRLLVSESTSGMAEKFPEVSVDLRFVRGLPQAHLVETSREHALVVIGHQPLSIVEDLFFPPVAPTVVEHAQCPVAVVPPSRLASAH